MTKLIRIKQGIFNIEDSYTLNDIENNKYKLLEIDDVLDYPVINMDDEMFFKVNNGRPIELNYNKEYVILNYLNKNIAIYKRYDSLYKMYVYLNNN